MKKFFVATLIAFCTLLLSPSVGFSLCDASVSAYAAEPSAVYAPAVTDAAPDNLQQLQTASAEQLDAWVKLPEFDGRTYGYITPERNQGGKSICWAYAAIGAVEAGILREGVDPDATKDNLDLDEIAAAYVRYNRDGTRDPLNLTNNDTYSDNWNQGSFAHDAFLSMTQGYSPISQTTRDTWSDTYIKNAISQSKYFIQGYTLIPNNREAIKRAILQYGAVTMEYKSPQTTWQKYLYYADGRSMGHASLIVGWDDSISSDNFSPDKPSENGAWIVKNSWGSGGVQVNGTYCFYLSYNSHLGSNLYAVDTALKKDYPNLYYYDGMVSDNSTQYITEAHGAIYEAKLSSPDVQEQLKAVVFGFRNKNLTATIKVYKNVKANPGNVNSPENIPTNGVLVAEKKDIYFANSGLYTVDLDTPVKLEQGEYFSIVVSGSDSDNNPMYPLYGSDGRDSVNDMTYRMYNNEWTSFKGGESYADTSFYSICPRIRAVTDTVPRAQALGNDLQYARVEIADRLLYYVKGQQQVPDISVYMGDKKLTQQQDYTVTLLNNELPGQATVIINGANDYFGTRTTSFEVAKPKYPPGALSGVITVYNNITTLHQIPIPPDWTWIDNDLTLEQGESYFHYSLRYIGDDADCYRIQTCDFKVNKINADPPDRIDLSDAVVQITGEYTYTGSPIVPTVTVTLGGVKLNNGLDYDLTCQNNVGSGVATVVIKGKGAYRGETTQTFTINKASRPKLLPDAVITVSRQARTLGDVPLNCADWYWQDPSLQIGDRLVATAVYKGRDKSEYIDCETQITVIKSGKSDISQITQLRLDQTRFVYDGLFHTPTVTAVDGDTVLVKDKDFVTEYADNLNAGNATVTVRGINDYVGSATLTFVIDRAHRQGFAVTQQGWTFGDGNIPQPEATVSDEAAPVTYAYSASENGPFVATVPTNAGTYWIQASIQPSQNYDSAVSKAKFTIARKDLGDFTVTVYADGLSYTGQALCPEVSVVYGQLALTSGVDFVAEYADNVNAGSNATVTVTGINNYAGSVVRNFAIAKATAADIDTTIRLHKMFDSLAEVALPQDFVWDEQSLAAIDDNAYTATAIYVGDNYDIDKLEFEIIIDARQPDASDDPSAPDIPDLPDADSDNENDLVWLWCTIAVIVAAAGAGIGAALYVRGKKRNAANKRK